MTPDATLPGAIGARYVPGYPFTPAWWLHNLDPLPEPPTLLMWHSGATGNNVARYLENPVCEPHTKGAVLCRDGLWRRYAATHFAATTRNGDFHQMLPLNTEAYGAPGYNQTALHVELPARQGPLLFQQARDLTTALVQVVPTLTGYSCHRWVSGNRRDPVCFSDEEVMALMAGIGLDMFRP